MLVYATALSQLLRQGIGTQYPDVVCLIDNGELVNVRKLSHILMNRCIRNLYLKWCERRIRWADRRGRWMIDCAQFFLAHCISTLNVFKYFVSMMQLIFFKPLSVNLIGLLSVGAIKILYSFCQL